jgi:branched-chain amino acid transport system permease protein
VRVVEEPASIFGHNIPGIPGMRMVVLSLTLLLVIIFRRRGLLGRWEFSWLGLSRLLRRGSSTTASGSGP